MCNFKLIIISRFFLDCHSGFKIVENGLILGCRFILIWSFCHKSCWRWLNHAYMVYLIGVAHFQCPSLSNFRLIKLCWLWWIHVWLLFSSSLLNFLHAYMHDLIWVTRLYRPFEIYSWVFKLLQIRGTWVHLNLRFVRTSSGWHILWHWFT